MPTPTESALARCLVDHLQISEIHDLAYDPVGKVMFGANQDTGSPIQSATDGLSWVDYLAGDGGDVGVDTTSKAPNSIRYLSNADFDNFEALTFNAINVQQGNAVFPALTRNAGTPKFTTQFATPLRVNSINQKRLLIGFGNDVYESLNQGAKIAAVDLGIVPVAPAVVANDSSGHVAMVYGGRFGAVTNADLVYVGSGGRVFRRTGPPGKPLVATAVLPGAVSINDVTIDPTNYLNVFAIDDTHVYQSVNGGGSWSNVTGNLATVKPGIFDCDID